MRSSAKFLSLFVLSVLVLPGCYTQLKVSESDNIQSEREYYSEYESDYQSYSADDTTYVSGYKDGIFDANRYFKNYDVYHRWNRYNHVSFNHYSPYSYYDYPYHRSYLSVSFGHGWASQGWNYYAGFGYGYGDPFFYDPFFAGFSPFYGHRGYYGYGSGFHSYGFPNYYAYYRNDFKRQRDDTKYQYGPRNSGSLSIDGRNLRISANGPSVSSAYLKSLAPDATGYNGNVRSEYLRPSRTGNSNNGALPSIGKFMRSLFESNGYTRSRTLNVDSPRTRGSRTGSSGTTVRKSRSGSSSGNSTRSSKSSSSSSSSNKRPSRVDR